MSPASAKTKYVRLLRKIFAVILLFKFVITLNNEGYA